MLHRNYRNINKDINLLKTSWSIFLDRWNFLNHWFSKILYMYSLVAFSTQPLDGSKNQWMSSAPTLSVIISLLSHMRAAPYSVWGKPEIWEETTRHSQCTGVSLSADIITCLSYLLTGWIIRRNISPGSNTDLWPHLSSFVHLQEDVNCSRATPKTRLCRLEQDGFW